MEEKWTCVKCQAENDIDSKFCVKCGESKPVVIKEGETTKATVFKCKNCHAPLQVDTETGLLKCFNCDSTFTYEELGMKHEDIDGIDFNPNSVSWRERYKIQPDNEYDTYSCPQCHAQVEVAKNDTWMKCPYCDSNLETARKVEGRITPDYVIPFQVSESKVIETLKEKFKGYFFLNKEFYNNLDKGEVRPLFLPLWSFSGDIKGKAKYAEEYEVTQGFGKNKQKVKKYYWYKSDVETKMISAAVDADKDFDNNISEALADYDMKTAVKYNSKAVMGIKAKQFSDMPTNCWNYLKKSLEDAVAHIAKIAVNNGKNSTGTRIRHKYEDASLSKASNIDIKNAKLKYGLAPVYHAHYNKSEVYVNGQTGTMAHTGLPLDMAKVLGLAVAILGANVGSAVLELGQMINGITWLFWIPYFISLFKCFKSSLTAKTRKRWFGYTKVSNFDNGYDNVSLEDVSIFDDSNVVSKAMGSVKNIFNDLISPRKSL